MTILHMAVFHWFDSVTDEQIDALCGDLAKIPAVIDGVRNYRFGRDLGLRNGNFDFGVVAELDGPEDVDRYIDHPFHQELVAKHIVHMVAERRAVQILLVCPRVIEGNEGFADNGIDF